MREFERCFKELLDSLSLAQISIEQTTSFILGKLENLDLCLDLWQSSVQKAEGEKLICLLYLANDFMQRVSDKNAREKFSLCVFNNISYFSSQSIRQILIRVVKIWSERKVISGDTLKKFKNLISETDKTERQDFSFSPLLGYLNIHNEIRKTLASYQCDKDKFIDKTNLIVDSKDLNTAKKYLTETIDSHSNLKSHLSEIRQFHLNCKLQTSHIGEYRKYYSSLNENALNSLEKYSEYRNRIIQLRWKVEKVKKKIEEIKIQKQRDDALMKDSHDVTDMDVDSQIETFDISPPVPSQNYPSHLTFDNPHMNTPTRPDSSHNMGHITSYESNRQSMALSDIWNQHRSYQLPHTVVDYNHGMNESNYQYHDVAPLSPHPSQNIQVLNIKPNDTDIYYAPQWALDPLKKSPGGNTNFYQ